jgi:quercetin dioxygenase-like cupin family protein
MKIIQIDPANWQEGRGYRKNRLLSAEELRQPGALAQVVVVPPGSRVPPHYHTTSVEVYLVRRGVCELVVNGRRHEMRPGDVILMEPGDVHELINEGPEEFEVMVFKTNAEEGDSHWVGETGQELLRATNEAYAALRNDPQAWQELIEERAACEGTLLDGLEDEGSV